MASIMFIFLSKKAQPINERHLNQGQCGKGVSMFGMEDPSQTLIQIQRYMDEGRLELAEVMSTQFTDLMVSKRKREPQDLIFAVKGLRLLCNVRLLRSKAKEGLKEAKLLLKERKALEKLLSKHAPHLISTMNPAADDLFLVGKIYSSANVSKKAITYFKKSLQASPNYIAAALEIFCIQPTPKHAQRLKTSIAEAGQVNKINGTYVIRPVDAPPIDLIELQQRLQLFAEQTSFGFNEMLMEWSRQVKAIEDGEQAANAQLQSALDALQPKHDYYSYG